MNPQDSSGAGPRVKELFLDLGKAARATRLYGPDHHQSKRFREALLAHLRELSRHAPHLAIELEPEMVLVDGEIVLQGSEVAGDALRGLSQQGLRGIVLEGELAPWESERLVELLIQDWANRGDFEEDLPAAAWRSGFVHLNLEVADRFADAEEAETTPSLAAGKLRSLAQALEAGLPAFAPDEMQLAHLRDLQRELSMDAPDAATTPPMNARLTGADRDAIDREVARLNEGGDDGATELGRVIFELVRLQPERARALGAELVRHLLAQLESDEIQLWTSTIGRTLQLLDPDLHPDWTGAEELRAGLASVLEGTQRRRLVEGLARAQQPAAARGPLFTLLAALPATSTFPLSNLPSELDEPELRQAAADALVLITRGQPEALLAMLSSTSGLAAVGPMLALSRLKLPRIVEPALRLSSAPEPQLREACLKALRPHQSPAIKQKVLEALQDPVEAVRVEALRYLSVYRDASALPTLSAALTPRALGAMSENELRAWLITIGRVGRSEAVPLLRDIAQGRGEWRHPRAVVAAARGLAATGSPGANELLADLARRHPELREEGL